MSHRKRHGKKTPIIRRRHLPGSPPGEMEVDPTAPPSRVTVFGFGPDDFVERRVDDLDELPALRAKWPVLWVNVDGLGDERVLSTLAEQFAIHRLVMEDVVNVPQRAKVEPYGDMLFIVSQMIRLEPSLSTEQYSIIVGAGHVVTFQEHVGDPFDQVRERIRQDRGRMRRAGADFLAYALIDALVDGYFPVLEHYGERIEAIEEEVLGRYDPELAGRTHAIKRELLTIRRTILPHREVLGALLREEDELMHRETHVYLRDCYDHVFQLLDMVETYRELTSGLLEVHLTFVGNHMNEIMKVLTIFAAIFIPLSFIAGLYGMNFAADSPWNMPELRWAFGYPVILGVMAVVAGGLLLFFRQRGWIGSRSTARKPAPHDHRPDDHARRPPHDDL